MNKNTNTQTDTEMTHMSLQIAQFFPHFYKMGKYLLPLLAGLFILAACGGGGAAPTTVTPDTTEAICATNVFDTRCDAPDVETKRNEKITDCITGDAAGNADCKNAVEAEGYDCLLDPFAEDCTAETVDENFAVHLEPAKKARADFCREGNNISKETELCGNAVTSLCKANPFDALCFSDATYRDMRIVACIGATPPTDSATVCRRSEITNIVCAATGVSAVPFNTEICGANDGVMNAAARQEFCRTNLSNSLCVTTISTFCATITAGNFANPLCGTPASAALRGTYCVGLNGVDVPPLCGDDATAGSPIRAYCESGSNAALLDTANCATSLAKVCETRPFGHACTSDANIRAQAVMCRNNQQGDNPCDATITAICAGKNTGGNTLVANPLDSLCADGTYDAVRQKECAGQIVTSPVKTGCADVISSLCTAEPFNPSAGVDTTKFNCADADSVTYNNARNARITLCTNAATNDTPLCRQTGVMAITDTCNANPFDDICDDYGTQYTGARDTRAGLCRDDVMQVGVDCADAMATVCDAGDTPFAIICGANDGIENAEQRQDFCRGALSNGSCPLTISTFCGDDDNNIFDRLCNTGYDTERGLACAATPSGGTLPQGCGSETSGYLGDFCATPAGRSNINCPTKFAAYRVNEAVWRADAVDLSGNKLSFVEAGAASEDDDLANFIKIETGVDFLGSKATDRRTNFGVPNSLTLNELTDSDDTNSGFVRAYNVFSISGGKHYVGLLPTTNLGSPITNNNFDGIWDAKILIAYSALAREGDFTLIVNFADGTIKTRPGLPVTTSDLSVVFEIDGKFNADGLISGKIVRGAVSNGNYDFNRANPGILTGLIGENGAVGIFTSVGRGAGAFAGGFVATLAGCQAYPFALTCTDDENILAQATACRSNVNVNGAGGCDATARAICVDGTTGSGGAIAANILDPLCLSKTEFVADIITACKDALNNEGVFAVCPARLDRFCPNSGARNPVCPDLAVADDKVDFVRWVKDAVDAGENDLTILDKITGTSDPIFSYVEGRRDGLERGDDYLTEEEKSSGLEIDKRNFGQFDFHQILKLSELAGSEDTSSGVAFRRFGVRNPSNNSSVTRYYAGILSNTDVGAPISDMNPTVLLWDARLQLVALSVLFEADFTMEVNFGDKTIKTIDRDMDALAVPRATVRTRIVLDSFSIDGTFTDTGVIYGTTELKRRQSGNPVTSTGTLTGLIGDAGAVGVFFNNVGQSRAGTYIGGFVAVPTSCEFYPFGADCTTDTDIRRKLAECNEDININGVGGCTAVFDIVCRDGNVGIDGGAIVGNPNDPLCAGNALTDNVDTARLKRDAVDTDGITPLTILTEVGAYDGEENYVQAGADDVNRGFLADEGGTFIGNPGRLGSFRLTLRDVGLADDAASGVKPERYVSNVSNPFISGTNTKFYAGIFSGTDLGAPLTAENTAETIWNAKFIMVDENGHTYGGDFTLEVNFGNKTINAAKPIALAFSSVTTGTLTLTGDFTEAGVIYGTSQLKLTSTRHRISTTDEFTSDGSLTGLIGEKGAVGAFISQGALDEVGLYPTTAGRYAGGFVARNNNTCLATPFDTNCYESLGIILARADMCDENMEVNGGAGGCNDTIADVCSIKLPSDSAINPFHAICMDGTSTYDESRRLSCISNRGGYIDVSDDKCAVLTTRICETENNPLNTICVDGTTTYDRPRQAMCRGDSVDESLRIAGCAPVINTLCNANPFKDSAGVGAARFDCNGSDVYHGVRQAACLLDNDADGNNCARTIAQTCGPDEDYFSDLCLDTNDDNFETYEQARIGMCASLAKTTNDFLTSIDGSDGKKCDDFLKATCLSKSFEDRCYIVGTYASDRLDKCSGVLSDLAVADATPADCNRAELSGAICAQTGVGANPFAPICAVPEAVAVDFDLVAVQQGFCRNGANINGQDCADTVTNFCDVAEGRDLFDDLCTTGNNAGDYDNYRVFACQVTNANNVVDADCDMLVFDNCTGTPPFSPACVPAGGALPPASVWAYTARNADNTARLRVLEEVGLDDAADTNYVQGDATGLNLGELLEAGERKTGVSLEEEVLSITDLDNVDAGDATGGVAFLAVFFDGFTSMNKVKHYAGLLNNVDLGAPLAGNTANAIWNARFSAIIKGAVQTDIDTSIVINFDNGINSLTTNDNDLVMLVNTGGNDAGRITINANFNAAGVIYGTSSWTSTTGAESATGSVTGLIGAKGAIGAFVSSGESTNDEEYAGGFVAAPVVECVGAVAFTNQICDGELGKAARIAYAETCRSAIPPNLCTDFVNGMDGPTFSACTHRTDSNPHQTGCEGDGFELERIARNAMCITDAASYDSAVCGDAVTSCFGADIANNCGSLVVAFCGAETDNRCDDAPAIKPIVCRDLPLDGRCDTGYDEQRQTACAGETVPATREECKPVIADFCIDNPFNNAQSAGAVEFDCAGSDTYIEQRQMACTSENIAMLSEGDRCLPVISALCDLDPFNNAVAGLGATTFNCTAGDTYHTARRDVCYRDIITNGGMNPACTATIAQACTDDIFDGLCFDRTDGKYSDYETARVSYCQARVFRTDGFTLPAVEGSTVCSAFIAAKCDTEPFEARCTIADDDAYASDRLRLCGGTIDDLTAAFATPADCNTDDLAGVICDTGNALAINPFAPICSDPTAVAMDLDLVTVRQGFCRDGANINEADCANTIANFCDVASGANLFDDLCTMSAIADNYTDYRVAACNVADANTDVHSTCTSVISTNCTGDVDTDSPACVTAGTLPTSAWLYGATNKDNTARLEILEEVGTDDAYTNYIQGDATGLNTDVLYDQGTLKADAIIRSGVLSITDLDNVDDNATGGVVAARISLPEFTDNPLGTQHRFYAGLLDNVDLGGPLRDNSADGIWNARFYALYGTDGTVQTDLETSMIVNFDTKSIKTRELADIYGPADPVVLSGGGGRITINANFTTAGVIYGRSSWSDGVLDGNSSAGTLTGLIGKYGAIGAFVGSGENNLGNTQGEYAGGFVAAPVVGCTQQTGNPFYRLCDATDNEVMMAKPAFAETCRRRPRTTGCDTVIVEATQDSPALTVNDCTDSDIGNPYQTGCLGKVGFDAERHARNLRCGLGDVSNAGQCAVALDTCFGSVTNAGCDAFVKATCDVTVNRDGRCDVQVPIICGDDPLNIICETDYADQRQTLCAGEGIANPRSECLPVIKALCDSDPFNDMAGVGTAKFNCTEGDTYLEARVTACETTPETIAAGSCAATRLLACAGNTASGGMVAANPFYTLCDDSGEYDGSYQGARDMACDVAPAAYGDGCEQSKTTHCGNSHNDRGEGKYTSISNLCRDDPRYVLDREGACLRNSDDPNNVAGEDICKVIRESVIAYRCNIDPFNSTAGASSRKYSCSANRNFDEIRVARATLCKNPDSVKTEEEEALCGEQGTQTFLASCARDPFNSPCVEVGNHYDTERAELEDSCRSNVSLPQCDVLGVRTMLCTIDELPFAPFCDTNDPAILGLRGTALRVAFCSRIIDDSLPADPRCVSVTAEFCPTAFGKPVLNSICDADYGLEQVVACRANMDGDGCPKIIEDNCPEGNTKPECAIATTAVWENHAVNSNNTARLDVLDEIGLSSPYPSVNYVKAGADGLDFSGIEPDRTFEQEVLKLYDAGTYEDTEKTSGVALGFTRLGEGTYDNKFRSQKYYAGILSGTDLGGVVTTKTEAEWTGKYGIMVSGRYYTRDFTLTIGFAGKTINGTDTNGCTVGEKTCPIYDSDDTVDDFVPNIIEKLDLTGGFNDAGVIYGTSRVTWTNPNLFVYRDCHENSESNLECRQERIGGRLVISSGTLTGLIGERGAVGVFAGVGTNTGGSRYVGGFVVDNPAVSPDCSTDNSRNLFNLVLCPSHIETNIVSKCRRKEGDPRPCPNLNLGEVRRDICKERGLSGVNLPTGVTVSDCSTPEMVTLICKATAAPLDPLCTDDIYDDTRQLVCGGQYVNNPVQPLCAPVIEKLCTAEPFNRSAGSGVNKFNCLSANSVGVVNARNTQITLCLAEATKDDPRCKQGDVSAALASCADNPLDRVCAADGIRAALTVCADNLSDPLCKQGDVSAALTACADNPSGVICTQGVSAIVSACVIDRAKEGGPEFALCQSRGVPAVLATCAADPFDAVCTDFATQYMEARETRLTTCRGGKNTRVDTNCDNARATICAQGGTPFAQICEDYDTTPAMMIAQTCATDATPAHDDCNTLVSGTVKVKDCIENPYKARCSSAVFYPARAAICESEATSFTAGCLSDSDFASNYRPIDVTDDRRGTLITRCTDSDTDNDEGCHTIAARTARAALIKTCAGAEGAMGCDTVIANSTTLLACINNPFLADCSGAEVAFALADSPDAVTRRDALVTRCGDSSMDSTGCDTIVGTLTLADCAMDKANLACSGGVFDTYYIEFDCTQAANLFAPRCQDGIDEAVIIARAELALGCDAAATKGENGCNTIIVSGGLTVDGCIADPFNPACSDAAFANIRRDSCIEAEEAQPGSSDAACGVAEGQGVTNYVQGGASELALGDSIYKHDNPATLDVHEGAVYVEDNPKTRTIDESVAVDTNGNPIADVKGTRLDESRVRATNIDGSFVDEGQVLREGIVTGGLTLNNLVEATDNDKLGFAFAYIPEGRGGIDGTDRYYAGLLSGTDESDSLGGEITADAKWNGKVSIVSGLGGEVLTEATDFVLTIDFDDKTLKSGDIAVPRLGGFFAIDGKFTTPTDTTDSGVIYGATRLWEDFTDGLSSIGSLIGLIGQDGAVGAFVSSGEGALVNTLGEYAGGFVASSGAPDLPSTPAVAACDLVDNALNPTCADTPNDIELCVVYDLTTLKALGSPAAYQTKCISVLERIIAREKACKDEADLNTLTNPLCEPVIARVCDGNIFKTDAGTGDTEFDCMSITRYAARRTHICSIPAYRDGATVELNGRVFATPRIDACDTIIARDICMDNPFAQTTGRNPTNLCDSTYDNARETTCGTDITNSGTNTAPAKCSDTIQQVCNANPFDANLCFTDTIDFTARQLHLCYADMNAGGTGVCATIIQTNCPTDGSVRNAECRSVQFTEWADGFASAEATIPAIETKRARILLGRTNGLDTKTNVTSIHASEFVLRFSLDKYNRVPHATETQVVKVIDEDNPSVFDEATKTYKLNLIEKTIPTYTNVLNKDYNSGIAVFSANTTGTDDTPVVGHYAGILSGTDVGAPITDPAVEAEWKGDIAWVSDNGEFVKRAYDFTLTVEFYNRKISGSGITDSLAHVPGYANTDSLEFSAMWNDTGILTGTTTLRIPNPVNRSQRTSYGILTGMIGNRGAVGVFASEPRIGNDEQPITNPFAYAGGFIARPSTPPEVSPNVVAQTWVTSFYKPGMINDHGDVLLEEGLFRRTDAESTYFIEALEDGLGLDPTLGDGKYAVHNEDNRPEFILRLDEMEGSAGYTSGAALYRGDIRDSATQHPTQGGTKAQYYGGLLSGTDVGTVLPYREMFNGEISATWGGRITARFGVHNGALYVGANNVGSGVGPTGITIDNAAAGNTFFVTDPNFQIEVDFVNGTLTTPTGKSWFNDVGMRLDGAFDRYGVIRGTIENAKTYDPGVFTGIIGQDAAVGVFKSSSGGGYIGGFVATACAYDVFNATCLENADPVARAAYCTNTTANLGTNPFDAGCSSVTDQMAVENAKRDACLINNAFPNAECQTLPSVRMACVSDPFTQVGCALRNDYQDIQNEFCPANPGAFGCPDNDDTKVTAGDWIRGQSAPLNTNPAIAAATTTTAIATRPKNEFLQIEGNTISIAGTTEEEKGAGGDPTPTTLDFSEITLATASAGLDTNDGLAYFSGFQGSILHHYAGIFGSTDLGAPIDESGFSATWIGLVSINATATPVYFTLNVAFDGADGTIDGFITNVSKIGNLLVGDLLIKGTFDASGVITGDVHSAAFASDTQTTIATPNGSLSGLISTDGVVAAFISKAMGTGGYAGGFVAIPLIDGICFTDIFDMACPVRVRTSIPVITAFCTNATDNGGTNPFNAGCSQASDTNAVETAQKVSCFANDTFPHVGCQTLVSVKMACVEDPFTAVCATRNDYVSIVAAYCARPENFDNTAFCPNANSDKWVASRTGLNTDPATTDAKNEFLQIADKTISTTGTTKEADGAGGDPEVRTLNLSQLHSSFSADDGLAYFSGYQGADLYHYAGIFATSDLGAPIDTDITTNWDGMLSINGVSEGFTLAVVFNGNDNTVKGDIEDVIDTNDLRIAGTFGANGVIAGKVHYGTDAQTITDNLNGDLSGLIGADGAVAVFIGAGYAGGFIAAPDPQVNFADWTGSFAGGFNNTQTLLDTGADATEFVADTTSFIPLNAADAIVLSNQTITDPTILRLSDTNTEDAYKSGVAFWHGNVGTIPQYYAGLLPTTDLGAPLTDVSKNGTWTGTIEGITNGDLLTNTEVKFEVIFRVGNTGTIKSISNQGEAESYAYAENATQPGPIAGVPATDSADQSIYRNTFDFGGSFNAQGVISGIVAHGNLSQTGASRGVFNGLIGVDGAVGVFKSHDSGQPYSFIGGFVAKPPTGN